MPQSSFKIIVLFNVSLIFLYIIGVSFTHFFIQFINPELIQRLGNYCCQSKSQMKAKQKAIHEERMSKIMRNTLNNKQLREDREYAEKELRKIYSEQMSKLMNSKKNFLLFQRNQQHIDHQYLSKTTHKVQRFNTLQERSIERRKKLLDDRVKVFKLNQKRWFLKTQAIKQKVKREEQSMVDVAVQYRQKAEKQMEMRKSEQKKFMKQFSQKYHTLYNSNNNTQREKSIMSDSFDQSRFQQLVRKRNRISSMRKSQNLEEKVQSHKNKQRFLTESKEKQKFEKLMSKLEKIDKIQIKREQKLTQSSIERAKSRLYQKVYKSLKPEIGPQCTKHEKKQQKFRLATEIKKRSRSASPASKVNLSQSVIKSRLTHKQEFQRRNEESMLKYCQKSRRLKITKLLQMNVRNALISQFKHQNIKNTSFSS